MHQKNRALVGGVVLPLSNPGTEIQIPSALGRLGGSCRDRSGAVARTTQGMVR